MGINPNEHISDSVESIRVESKTFISSKKVVQLVSTDRAKTKGEEIQALFVEWSHLSTSHCYPKIFQYKNPFVKLIWILFFLVFACLTSWFLIFGVLNYFEFEVVSKIRVYNEETLVYPVVTICDANPFTTKYAEDLLEDSVIQDETLMAIMKYEEKNPIRKKLFLYFLKMQSFQASGMYKAFHLNDTDKQKLGISFDSVLQSCYFNGNMCTISDFRWVFNYMLGNCFQFNSANGLKETKMSGLSFGFALLIGNLTNYNKYTTFFSSGLRIFIHNSSYFSTTASELFVETGKHTSISIKKTHTLRASMPYSDCRELNGIKSAYFDYIKSLNGHYRQKDCLELCLQKFIIDSCKCFFSMFTFLNTTHPPCYTQSDMECYLKTFYASTANIDTLCSQECPLECDYVTYELTASSLSYPNKHFFEEMKNVSKEYENMSIDELKGSHLALNIFYPNKEYTEISESPKTNFVDLISNLGGALGIFLGLSVFSFIEIFEVMLKILFVLFRKNNIDIRN